MAPLSERELAHIEIVCTWAVTHPDDLWMNYLLSSNNINRFFMSPTYLHVLGREFLITDVISHPLVKSGRGVIIAPKVREKRSKKKDGGDKGKGKRTRFEGSIPSLPPQRRALAITDDTFNHAFIPLTTVTPLDDVHYHRSRLHQRPQGAPMIKLPPHRPPSLQTANKVKSP